MDDIGVPQGKFDWEGGEDLTTLWWRGLVSNLGSPCEDEFVRVLIRGTRALGAMTGLSRNLP